MHQLHELIDDQDPAWPLVMQWIREAAIIVEPLPTDRATGGAALLALQVTTRSPMGAITYQTAGFLLDSGWLRILGAGGHPRCQRSLPGWNVGRSNGFYLVADDAIGGFFALNGGALGEDHGKVYYIGPEGLQWEPCRMTYSQFLVWAMSGKLQYFYAASRWEGWQAEVRQLTGDQVLFFYPFLCCDGPPLVERYRKPVPVAELYHFHVDEFDPSP